MDRLLVERARAVDRDAFGELMVHRMEGAYRMALDILGRPADARDATQETFIAVWRGLPSLREPDRFDAWFNRMLLNSCRMAMRRHRRVREITFSSALRPPLGFVQDWSWTPFKRNIGSHRTPPITSRAGSLTAYPGAPYQRGGFVP